MCNLERVSVLVEESYITTEGSVPAPVTSDTTMCNFKFKINPIMTSQTLHWEKESYRLGRYGFFLFVHVLFSCFILFCFDYIMILTVLSSYQDKREMKWTYVEIMKQIYFSSLRFLSSSNNGQLYLKSRNLSFI